MSDDEVEERQLCDCGEPLVEDADGRLVTIGELTFPFSRSTDFVMCENCGQQIPIEQVHPDQEPATRELHALTRSDDQAEEF